jgi:hypothetical protein
MACDGLITADMLNDCLNGSIGGLETNVLIINSADIDRAGVTYDAANKTLMTGFALQTGKVGFLLQGVKQVNNTAWELVKKETGLDKKKHVFNGLMLTLSAANKLQLELMSEGANLVIIVEKKWKGTGNVEAFDVYGIGSGLELNVATYNSNENDGSAVFELSSADSFEEARLPATLLVGDYSATKTLFDNKFLGA